MHKVFQNCCWFYNFLRVTGEITGVTGEITVTPVLMSVALGLFAVGLVASFVARKYEASFQNKYQKLVAPKMDQRAERELNLKDKLSRSLFTANKKFAAGVVLTLVGVVAAIDMAYGNFLQTIATGLSQGTTITLGEVSINGSELALGLAITSAVVALGFAAFSYKASFNNSGLKNLKNMPLVTPCQKLRIKPV